MTTGYLHEIGRDAGSRYQDDGWLATIAYQQAAGSLTRHYFITGVLGHRAAHDCEAGATGPPACTISRPWGVFFGMTFEEKRGR